MPEIAPESNPPSRIELLQLAQSLGVSDADVMTRAELRTAIDRARRPAPIHTDQHPTTWVSVARRLLASVVERGLNLPDAASLIRGDTKLNAPPKAPPPVATVTLARIYGAQGHFDRAIATLNEVLESDPDHELARDLRNQLAIRRTESLARTSSAAPTSVRHEPESTPGVPSNPVTPAERSNHAPKPSRLGTLNALDGIEARPFAGLGFGAEAPNAEARVLAATEAAEVVAQVVADAPMAADAQTLADARAAADAQAHADAQSLADAPSSADSPTSAQPPPFVDASASDPPATEATHATSRLDADAELVSPAFASTPSADVQPPPFVDAHTGSDPAFNGAPPSAQPPAFVDAHTGSDPAFNEAPPSAQPPPFVDAHTGSDPAFNGAPPSAQPPAYVDTPAFANTPGSAPPIDDARGLIPPPPAIRLDPDAELVAPALDGIEHDAPPIETLTERPATPALYTEPPTMVSTMALDRETLPDPSVYLENTRADDALSAERHPGSAPSNTGPLPDPAQAIAEPTPASVIANTPPSHTQNGFTNGIQVGVEPLPFAAPLPPSPPPPQVPGLVLIETDTPMRYLYWELAASSVGAVHWIYIVTHTPSRGGIERHERRFPIQRPLGALRLEGVPANAVVRARLTRDGNDARALVVAGAVRPRALGGPSFDIRYNPHAHSRPEALATRAQPLLERASPVYWDL